MTDTTITLSIRIDTTSFPTSGIARVTRLFVATGRTFEAFLAAYGNAAELVYGAPYQSSSKRQKYGLEEDMEGRDPNW